MQALILREIIGFVILALIGIASVKSGILNESHLNGLSVYIMKVSMPVFMFTYTLNSITRDQLAIALPVCLAVFAISLFCYGVSYFAARLCRLTGERRNLYRGAFTFGNVGAIGVPLIASVAPQGILYLAMYILADQTLFWTLGYALSLPLSDMKNLTLKMRLKKILNPVIIGILLALFGILINLQLPDVLNQTLTKVGQSCLSISLIYIGGLFCYIDIKKALKRLEFYLIIPIKMLLIPTLLFLLFSRLSIDPVMAATLTICCALPTMISLPMIAQTNGTDGEYLIGGLLITTLFSIFTLPLVGAVIAFLS